MSDLFDELNASHTAERWLEQDVRALFAALGMDEFVADWAAHSLTGPGMDVALARAAYELSANRPEFPDCCP
ncbi:hypothetical protein [Nocardia wallacei]|uniref:hypothetical protein n=1 Tax=Nocardia wallacei TaxID=480035 RepID=UPI002455CC1F|nr:hypothetical protein [Nocardia wallacei]